MMDLYRKHNANPMSGCWPMLFQLPILWGLFQMLQYSIDLRQQPFVLWVSDLSKPDTIAHWGGFPINILPVLMTVCSLVQQLTMPKPADPQQAQTQKMMMFMPVMFLFMFYGMASGLVLYWLTSTFLGIVEQKLIKLQIQRMEAHGAFAAETVAEDAGANPAEAEAAVSRLQIAECRVQNADCGMRDSDNVARRRRDDCGGLFRGGAVGARHRAPERAGRASASLAGCWPPRERWSPERELSFLFRAAGPGRNAGPRARVRHAGADLLHARGHRRTAYLRQPGAPAGIARPPDEPRRAPR